MAPDQQNRQADPQHPFKDQASRLRARYRPEAGELLTPWPKAEHIPLQLLRSWGGGVFGSDQLPGQLEGCGVLMHQPEVGRWAALASQPEPGIDGAGAVPPIGGELRHTTREPRMPQHSGGRGELPVRPVLQLPLNLSRDLVHAVSSWRQSQSKRRPA